MNGPYRHSLRGMRLVVCPGLFFAGPVPIPGEGRATVMRTLLDVSALPNLSLSPFAAILAEVMVRWERKNGKGALQALSPVKQDRFPSKNDEKIQKGSRRHGAQGRTPGWVRIGAWKSQKRNRGSRTGKRLNQGPGATQTIHRGGNDSAGKSRPFTHRVDSGDPG